MIKILIDGVEYIKGSDEHLAKVNEMHKAEIAKARGEADALKIRTDAADKNAAELEALRKEKAERERGDALAKAKSALGASFVEADFTAEMNAAQIRRLLASKAQGGKDLSAESDEYVRAFCDLLEVKAAPAAKIAPASPAGAPAAGAGAAVQTADARGVIRVDAANGGAPPADPFVQALLKNDEGFYGKDFPVQPYRRSV